MKFKSTKQFIGYLFEGNDSSGKSPIDWLTTKSANNKTLLIDKDFIEFISNLSKDDFEKASTWLMKFNVDIKYSMPIEELNKLAIDTLKIGEVSSIAFLPAFLRSIWIKKFPENNIPAILNPLNESLFDTNRWQKMAGIFLK
jgi:hypothetical protein